MKVYINDAAAFLPNAPVENDAMEAVLGQVGGTASRARRIVLKSNRIIRRHYAIDPATGRPTHTNAELTAEAVRALAPHPGFAPEQVECLCCGTSTPDVMLPGHALMVAGELGLPPREVVTTAGICMSGMTAFKYAFMNVAAGLSENAVATGSELASSFTRSAFLTPCLSDDADLERRPIKAFDADFLRWMLSDGAGAVYLSNAPTGSATALAGHAAGDLSAGDLSAGADDDSARRPALSLRVEWIENISYSGSLETCMYAGGVKREDGAMAGWRAVEEIGPAERPHLFTIRQDIRLLDRHIVSTMGDALTRCAEKHELTAEAVDWFLPHYSSAYFRDKFHDEMIRVGFPIPYERWFTNLPDKGNTGSAAIFIILADMMRDPGLRAGQKLLCFVPESGRFSHCFMLLEAV